MKWYSFKLSSSWENYLPKFWNVLINILTENLAALCKNFLFINPSPHLKSITVIRYTSAFIYFIFFLRKCHFPNIFQCPSSIAGIHYQWSYIKLIWNWWTISYLHVNKNMLTDMQKDATLEVQVVFFFPIIDLFCRKFETD